MATAVVHTAPVQRPATDQGTEGAPLVESRDLGALSEVEFDRAIQRLELRKVRAQRIFQSVLIENVHYGIIPGTKKPSLYKAGADELTMTFGLELCYDPARPDVVVEGQDYTSVTVYRAIIDRMGRVLDRATASCTTKEKRFKGQGGGWTYTDARETLNTCLAIAEKRAKGRLVVSALGLAPFLGTEDEMEKAMAERGREKRPLTPWTEAEKTMVGDAAASKGMTKEEFIALRFATLGRNRVGTGHDVERVLAAIKNWQPPKKASPDKGTPPASPTALVTAKELDEGADDEDFIDDRDIAD